MIRAAIGIVVMLAVVVLAWRAQERNKDTASLDGEWKITSGIREGRTEEQNITVRMIISGNKWTMKLGDRENPATFTTDTTVSPATIDMTLDVEGEDAVPGKGIWKLKGDTLTVCFAMGEGERPTDFSPTKDNVVFVCERVKK